jgi:uncharacterized protein YjbJ (UPF0337 family)
LIGKTSFNTKKMNLSLAKGNWYMQKGRLKQRFAAYTRNLMMYEEGREEEVYGKLQIKLSKTKPLPYNTLVLS